MLGLSHEVDQIDNAIIRIAQTQQIAPAGLTPEQYIQDIYRRLTALASQIQQIQLQQQPIHLQHYQLLVVLRHLIQQGLG